MGYLEMCQKWSLQSELRSAEQKDNYTDSIIDFTQLRLSGVVQGVCPVRLTCFTFSGECKVAYYIINKHFHPSLTAQGHCCGRQFMFVLETEVKLILPTDLIEAVQGAYLYLAKT